MCDKNLSSTQAPLAYPYNPSYSGGSDQEEVSPGKYFETLSQKKKKKKKKTVFHSVKKIKVPYSPKQETSK
jgi:hypothetical protein